MAGLVVLVGCGGPVDEVMPALTAHGGDESSTHAGSTTMGPDASSTTEDGGETTGGVDPGTTGDSTTGIDETTGEPEPQACAVVSIDGMCGPVSSCGPGSTAFGGGLCDGPPSQQCCVPAEPPCSVDGAPGVCMDVAQCGAPLVATAGLCPGDSNIQCCTDPQTACDPDEMPSPNDGLVEQRWDAECPRGMVAVEDFCVDRFEASLVELDAAGDPVGGWSPFHNPGGARVRAVSLEGAIPQGYISGDQAADACAEAGKRLCGDSEWLRACQGAAGNTYPYGDARQPGTCNDARERHPAIEFFGTSADWIWSELGHACISQIPASVAVTGQHEDCRSEEGVHDMMGNLHEWTSAASGTFRGGFYADTSINGEGCMYATTAHNTAHWDYSTGFRCCADPL